MNDIERQRFVFLNQPLHFDGTFDWRVAQSSRLWRYNLHYFDYLFPDRPLDWDSGRRLMLDWIHANPEGTPDAWDPFPVSLRLVNWIKYLSAGRSDGNVQEIHRSLYDQTRYLARNLEFHLLANHLFKNIKALLFAGLFFSGKEAEQWFRRGRRLLIREIGEQILPDGGHFERSPMYHAMVLEDVLDLLNILPTGRPGDRDLQVALSRSAAKMTVFLQAMCHPDGDMALFNDAALGIEHTAVELTAYHSAVTGQPLPDHDRRPLTAFPDSGYFILSPSDSDKLIIDCGAVGPDYQPGHAHCDTLSFEMCLKGRRVIVDAGCCQYDDGAIRQYNRGNAGHNTVTIDGQNQSEVWGAHRCARRAYPLFADLREAPGSILVFDGAHDGYQRLSGRPVHRRRVHWQRDTIDITDRIEGSGRHTIASALHFSPDMDITLETNEARVCGPDGLNIRITGKGSYPLMVEKSWYCPEFNRQLACRKLTVAFEAALPVDFGWRIQIL